MVENIRKLKENLYKANKEKKKCPASDINQKEKSQNSESGKTQNNILNDTDKDKDIVSESCYQEDDDNSESEKVIDEIIEIDVNLDKSEILDDPPSPDNSINEMQMSPEEIDEFIEETESNTESERTVIPLDEQECADEQMLNKIAKFRDEDMVLGMELRCKTGKIKNWYRMNKLIGIANRVLPRIVPLECDITELNRLYYATERAIGELMNVKVERTKKERKKKKRKSPLWKYRLESEIQKLRQEISLIIAYQQGVIRTEQKIRRVQN